MIIYVTHYEKENPPKKGFVKLAFMTTQRLDAENRTYHMGFGGREFSQEFLTPKIASGSLVPLSTPHPIQKNQGLWIDAQSKVFIADKNDPFSKKMVEIS